MHTVEHHVETGQFGPTLSSTADSKTKATSMRICEPWIEVYVPKSKDPTKTVKILIPITNFKTVVLE
jgi:hypothetical protein